ncbi:MAG: Fpg/Nei family DNA glycosylase [Gammaproteobacteria bacterium]
MPEGDTLHRVAAAVGAQLTGQQVIAARGRADLDAGRLDGARLDRAAARGKHLLLDFDGALSVHSHLGMTGAWHLYPRGEPWRKPARRAALALRFEARDLVCFSPRRLAIGPTTRLRRDAQLERLGPDLLAPSFDLDAALARLRTRDGLAVGEAIMSQQLVAGIGNVYKSEVLFMARINPFAPLAGIDDAGLGELLGLSRRLMRRNLEGARRKFRYSTVGERLFVYRRAGLPCLVCGTTIGMRRQGDAARSTYYCASCQGVAG